MKIKYISLAIVLLIGLIAFGLFYNSTSIINKLETVQIPKLFTPKEPEYKYKKANITFTEDLSITADIADTEELRSKGLSNRSRLNSNQGMIFIFDKPGFYGFWMKDMRFAIDIIWFNENWEIIEITPNVRPNSYPKNFIPLNPVKYVLEVPNYFSSRNNLKIGDSVTYQEIVE